MCTAGTFPFLMVAAYLQIQWATGASNASDDLYAGANQYISEAFTSIRVIHAFNLQSYIVGQYNAMLVSRRHAQPRAVKG